MDDEFLEKFYEKVILPQYGNDAFGYISWIDHVKVGLDTFAHYFYDSDGKDFVLVVVDFTGSTDFDDGLPREAVLLNGEKTLRLSGDPPFKDVENITGYYTLYKIGDVTKDTNPYAIYHA